MSKILRFIAIGLGIFLLWNVFYIPSDLKVKNKEEKTEALIKDLPVSIDTPKVFIDTVRIDIVPIVEALPLPDTIKEIIQETLVIDTGQLIVQIAESYKHVREATGKNDGPEVKYFLSTVGLPEGYYWCAAYVKAVLLEAGVASASKINGMALSCENKSNMVYQKGVFLKEALPGDVATFYYPSLKRIGHTGFHVKRYNSIYYYSNEGNSNDNGSSNGDRVVHNKKRSYNATHSISRWR